MSENPTHVTAERLQEWLDGRLSSSEAAVVQAHLDECAHCQADAEMWISLVADLSSLPALTPAHGFTGRVLAGLGDAPQRASWAARARAWSRAWSHSWLGRTLGSTPSSEHPGAAALQDLLTGALARRQSTRVRRHLEVCASCRRETQTWSVLLDELDALPRLAPSAGFGRAVMARIRVPEPAPARVALIRRVLDRVRALAGPGRRQAWAALAGVAFTPAIVAGLVAYAVFSHPLVTVGNVAAFLWLKGSAVAGGLGSGVTTSLAETASQNAAIFRAWSALETLTRSPAAAGAGLLVFSTLTLIAIWVLYRNVFSASARPAYAPTHE